MSKRPQKIASVVLAVMMVWAVMPVLGVAEDVTTPSDLPQVTEVPTEEPTEVSTEVPTEAPTEEPVEEVPPVLVEEPVEPPMLMATAQVDLTTYGITPGEGAVYNVTDDCITLQAGSFSGSINDGSKTIVIESGATLTITSNASFNKITVNGSLIINGRSINLNGAVTVAGGSLSSTGRWDGSNVISQLTINSTSGINTKYTYVNVLNLPESWLRDIALSFANADLGVYPDATPPTANCPASDWITISYAGVNLEAFNYSVNHHKCKMYFEYKPVEPVNVVGSEPVEYEVTFHNGGNNPKFNIMVPVRKDNIKVHVEGRFDKVYDGTGDFSGELQNYEWVDEGGNSYRNLDNIKCTISGTWDGGIIDMMNFPWDYIPCNVTVTSQNLPAGYIFEQTGKVRIRFSMRDMTLTPKDLVIYEGETPALEVVSNTGVDVGLAPNQSVECDYKITRNSDGAEMTGDLPVGEYTISIRNYSIKDASGNEVDSRNYNIQHGTGTLIVKEPTYTVTIPAGVELTGGAGSMAIDCEIHGKISVDVAATSANGWKLVDGSQSLDYTLTPEASATRAATGNALASFTETGTANLAFATNPKPAAGTYTDTLTFTVTANK